MAQQINTTYKEIEDKEIKIRNDNTKQDIKIRVVKDKFIEIIIEDFSKKNIKYTYSLIEGKENLNKILEVLKWQNKTHNKI